MLKGLLSLAQLVSHSASVEFGVLITAEVCLTERLYRISVIVTLLLLNLNDLEHANEHASEKNSCDKWLECTEDVTTGTRAVAAVDEERQDEEDDNENRNHGDVVNETEVIKIKLKNLRCILSVHHIPVADELPRNRGPHPERLGVVGT